jgi:hypothetical protein
MTISLIYTKAKIHKIRASTFCMTCQKMDGLFLYLKGIQTNCHPLETDRENDPIWSIHLEFGYQQKCLKVRNWCHDCKGWWCKGR